MAPDKQVSIFSNRTAQTPSGKYFGKFTGFLLLYISDIEVFSTFENGHYVADQVYFYESNSEQSANLVAGRGACAVI